MPDTMSTEGYEAAKKRNQDARVVLAMHLDNIAEGIAPEVDEIHEWWVSLVDSCADIIADHEATTTALREAEEALRLACVAIKDERDVSGCESSGCPVYEHAAYDIPECQCGCMKGLEHAFYGQPDEREKFDAACLAAIREAFILAARSERSEP